MPHITVEYSQMLADCFDRRAFALALHPRASEIVGSDVSSFKTRFYALDDTVVGNGDTSHAMVHVDFRLLAGRPTDLKQYLGREVLTMARDYIHPQPGLDVQVTVEVRDLDRPNYHKVVLTHHE